MPRKGIVQGGELDRKDFVLRRKGDLVQGGNGGWQPRGFIEDAQRRKNHRGNIRVQHNFLRVKIVESIGTTEEQPAAAPLQTGAQVELQALQTISEIKILNRASIRIETGKAVIGSQPQLSGSVLLHAIDIPTGEVRILGELSCLRIKQV